MSVRQKLSETESTFAFIIGGGLFLLMTGFGIAALRPGSGDNPLTNGLMIVGAGLFIAGSILWAIVTEPWRNFDNWSKPLFTGHDDHHADVAHEDHAPAAALAQLEPAVEPVMPARAAHPKAEKAELVAPAEPEPAQPAKAPATAAPEAAKRDNLQLIEGIGPKIAGALYAAGIETFGHLAAMPATDVERIVKTAGVRMVGRADAWVEQARLAAAGKMDELAAYQKELGSRK